jgi:hypothetical protein
VISTHVPRLFSDPSFSPIKVSEPLHDLPYTPANMFQSIGDSIVTDVNDGQGVLFDASERIRGLTFCSTIRSSKSARSTCRPVTQRNFVRKNLPHFIQSLHPAQPTYLVYSYPQGINIVWLRQRSGAIQLRVPTTPPLSAFTNV